MRLRTLHPKYLDSKGLVAPPWRKALLAQAVSRGKTAGYRAHSSPVIAIGAYLAGVHSEASARGYSFDRTKIAVEEPHEWIPVTEGQIEHEWHQLMRKLSERNPELCRR